MNILISAGHHPMKPGACHNGFCEHDEATRWVDKLIERLGDIAIRVPAGTLKRKIEFINTRKPDVAIEIHFNSTASGEGRGSETLYYPGSEAGKKLATVIQGNIASVFEPDRGIKEGWYRMDPSKGADFFLERTTCPAVIVEPEFIHHREEIQAKRDHGCRALSSALFDYMNMMEG